MEITSELVNDGQAIQVIRVNGDFDLKGANQFDAAMGDILQQGPNRIVVDLSKVHFMSSAGIRSINELFYSLHPYDKDQFKSEISPGIRSGTYKAPNLKLLNPNTKVENALRMVGLDMYLEIFHDEQEALEALKNI